MKYFTKEHEWVDFNDGIVTLGISNHAAEELGDITFVELPEVDADFNTGDVISVVESVKAASDIYAPVAGTVIEVNEDLDDAPELVNEAAEVKGWICKLSGVSEDALSGMMTEEQYKAYIS